MAERRAATKAQLQVLERKLVAAKRERRYWLKSGAEWHARRMAHDAGDKVRRLRLEIDRLANSL